MTILLWQTGGHQLEHLMKYWYLVHTKPRLEQVAAENLIAQNFSIFMPTIIRQRLKKGHWIKLVEPLFPNYLFIQLDAKTANWSAIRCTKGVNKLVSFGNSPAKVSQEIIEQLLLMNEQEVDQTGVTFPKTGECVKVHLGEQTLNAVLGLEDANQRVWVLLDFLGRQQSLLVDKDQIRPN